MTSRPPSSSSTTAAATSRASHPTPHHTVSRSRSVSSSRIPPHAPKPNRRPTDLSSSTSISAQTNPVFNLGLVPRASCGKADDILAPPDAQSCPFAKAGLKVIGIGTGAYGELEGSLEWPAELYANEQKQTQMTEELSALLDKDGRPAHNKETLNQLMESLRPRVEKLKEDEWMYSSTDILFKGVQERR